MQKVWQTIDRCDSEVDLTISQVKTRLDKPQAISDYQQKEIRSQIWAHKGASNLLNKRSKSDLGEEKPDQVMSQYGFSLPQLSRKYESNIKLTVDPPNLSQDGTKKSIFQKLFDRTIPNPEVVTNKILMVGGHNSGKKTILSLLKLGKL